MIAYFQNVANINNNIIILCEKLIDSGWKKTGRAMGTRFFMHRNVINFPHCARRPISMLISFCGEGSASGQAVEVRSRVTPDVE
jgi:hypothetical protein